MAKVRMSAIIAAASGPVGGMQFARSAGGTILRSRPNRRPTPTKISIDACADLRRIRYFWDNCNPEIKTYWQWLAPQLTWSDRLNQSYHPTGWQAYARFLSYYLRFKITGGTNSPSANSTDQPTEIIIAFQTSPAFYAIKVTTPFAAGYVYCGLYGAVLYRPNRRSGHPPFRYFTTIKNEAAYVNLYSEWTAVLPPLQPNQWVALKVVAFHPNFFPAAPMIETRKVL